MDIHRLKSLSARQRALVCVAVLLDGREAGMYLESDAVNGQGLKRVAHDLASIELELRMPFLGTVLRTALSELTERRRGK